MALIFKRLLSLCVLQVLFGTTILAEPTRVERNWVGEFLASVKQTLKNHTSQFTTITEQLKVIQDQLIGVVNNCQANSATSSPQGSNEENRSFQKIDINILNEIITNAYGKNVRNVENIITFCELFDVHLQAEILSTVYKQMVNLKHLDNYQIFQLAYKLKQLIESHPEIEKLFVMKEELPSLVRTIIFENSNVCVKTQFFGKEEYLFTEKGDFTFDNDRRYVFTNRGNKLPVGLQGAWIFEPDQDARFFSIKNKVYDEYLFAGEDIFAFDGSRRRTFTWKAKTKIVSEQWQLEPSKNASIIYFKQRFVGEYLYPYNGNDYDSSRRFVFTWRSRDKKGATKNPAQYQWSIETCAL